MTKERVISEYSKALKAVEAKYSHVSGEVVFSDARKVDLAGNFIKQTKCDSSISGSNELYTLDRLDDAGAEVAAKTDETKKWCEGPFNPFLG